jgi:trehalose 6-phosphate synthase
MPLTNEANAGDGCRTNCEQPFTKAPEIRQPSHVVLVSDRGPVQFTRRSLQLVCERQSSSVTALLHRLASASPAEVTWVSPSTSAADAQAMQSGLFAKLARELTYTPHVVVVDERDHEQYYYDAGVNIIWSAWHGIEDKTSVRWNPDDPLASLTSYARINRQLSLRVSQVAAQDAVVAVQDYQLLLAPAMIRELRSDVRIVHFSHTPFPDSDSLAWLPPLITRTLVAGMLGADVLGFQSPRWANRFMRCCHQLGLDVDAGRGKVRYGERDVWVRCYPVTVDIPSLIHRSRSAEASRWADITRAEDRRMRIVRVDRLDPAKNALRGFQAYSLLQQRHPSLAQELRFVACMIPSRERLPDYQRYARGVWQIINDVNRRYPGAITAHYGNNPERALGIMRDADVLLVNSVADGMNLVAQEGAIINNRDAAVVLSRDAGAADLLPDAVILDRPTDVTATADALALAMTLSPLERRDRAERMRAAISRVNPASWLERQLADALSSGSTLSSFSPPSYDTKLP